VGLPGVEHEGPVAGPRFAIGGVRRSFWRRRKEYRDFCRDKRRVTGGIWGDPRPRGAALNRYSLLYGGRDNF